MQAVQDVLRHQAEESTARLPKEPQDAQGLLQGLQKKVGTNRAYNQTKDEQDLYKD